jgi:hypothetical protein
MMFCVAWHWLSCHIFRLMNVEGEKIFRDFTDETLEHQDRSAGNTESQSGCSFSSPKKLS